MKKRPRRWWISWYEPLGEHGDYRPLTWPLPPEVPAFWCSGYAGAHPDLQATLCAVVDAKTESMARAAVRKLWKPAEWRFCEERPDGWMPPADRFPPKSAT